MIVEFCLDSYDIFIFMKSINDELSKLISLKHNMLREIDVIDKRIIALTFKKQQMMLKSKNEQTVIVAMKK